MNFAESWHVHSSFHRNRHQLQRLQIRVLIRHLNAPDELHAFPDRCDPLQLRQHLRLDDVVQPGGNVIELLRVGKRTGIQQPRPVAHRVAEHQSQRHENIHVIAFALSTTIRCPSSSR